MTASITHNLLQILVVMAAAPLYAGVLSRLKEIVQSKRGPSIVQPYRDIWKLFQKDEVVSRFDGRMLSAAKSWSGAFVAP